jgi:hypothetical protein
MNIRKIKNYDLFPLMALSESYVDQIMSGFLIKKTLTSSIISGSQAFVTGNRVKIGSAISGSNYAMKQIATDFGFFSNIVSGSVQIEKHAGIRFLNLIDSNEILFDSIPPSFDDCMKKYGKGMTLLNVGDPSKYHALNFVYILSTPGFPVTSSYAGETISDSYWLSSFPMSNVYRGTRRVKSSEQFLNFSKLTYYASSSVQDVLFEPKFLSGFTTLPMDSNVVSYEKNPSDAFWNGNGSYVLPAFVSVCYFLSGANINDNASKEFYEDRHYSLLATQTGTVNGSGIFSTFYSVFPEADPIAVKPKQPEQADLIKHVFGFGDGVDGYVHGVSFSTHTTSSFSVEQKPAKIKYGSRIKGWKYGLLSGFETKKTAIFRRDHFGQFRDMLEQRIIGKTLKSDSNTITSPITVEFVSGTVAYFSASNPTLNTRDSGIYSYEYLSGRPFADI